MVEFTSKNDFRTLIIVLLKVENYIAFSFEFFFN